jgi:hypothetical protein
MTSSYRDPNVAAALAYQAEQEQRRKAQEQPNFLDIAGRTALGLGVAALAGAGIARGLRRNAVKPVTVQDLGANAEETVRRAARATTTPPPSRPAPPAGVARQQAAEEFTRQARAERPVGVSQVNIQDLIEPSFALPQEPSTGTPYSVSEIINLANQTKTKSPQLYGQVPQVAEQVVPTVKGLLPPARRQSTDFLRNQLGSRGYIEQSILVKLRFLKILQVSNVTPCWRWMNPLIVLLLNCQMVYLLTKQKVCVHFLLRNLLTLQNLK